MAPREGAAPVVATTTPEGNQSELLGTRSDTPAAKADQSPKKSWRSWLPVHPFTAKFPPLSRDELQTLADDIKKDWLHNPCHFWRPDGRPELLTGRHRLDALELIGEEIAIDNTIIFEEQPHDIDPVDFIISDELYRRHLGAEDKRRVIAALLKDYPSKSNRYFAGIVKASHNTVQAVRTEMERRGQIDHVAKRTDTKGRQQPSTKPQRPSPHKFKKGGEPVNWVVDAAKRQVTEVPKPAEPAKPPLTGEAIPAFLRRTPELARVAPESKPITLERFLLVDPDREWSLIPNYFAEALALTIERMPSIERRGFLANLRKIIDRQESFISGRKRRPAAREERYDKPEPIKLARRSRRPH
jgi:hypothetical protein